MIGTDFYRLESEVIGITNRMSQHGVPFNRRGCLTLRDQMEVVSSALAERIQVQWPPREVCEEFIPKRNNKTKGYSAGVPFIKRKMVAHNPCSTQQNIDRLMEEGWQPTELTDAGNPSLNAGVLATVDLASARVLEQFKVTDKRQSMIEGERGWLASVDDDDRLRTNYRTLGTVTGRASHSPNVAQVPKVMQSADGPVLGAEGKWGFECRSLFGPPAGWLMIGSDMKGLELRCFAHYLFPYDNGNYARLVCTGDPHAATQNATGLNSRERAKTLIYAMLYGCGDYKAGHVVQPWEDDEYLIRALGRETKKALVEGIPGFGDLLARVEDETEELVGLDGRPLFIRKRFAALNTLLQSAGAIACKRWLVLVDQALQQLGLAPDEVDYEFGMWVHDEIQLFARTPEIAAIIAETCKAQAVLSGEYYAMNCPLEADARIGANWACTH